MKYLLAILLLSYMPLLYSQQDVTLFAQCVFDISDEVELREIEAEIREHPNVQIVRLDQNTQRAFILTKETDELLEDELSSWFGEFSESVRCIQIGVYGVDKIDKYPFENCEQ